MEAKTETDDEKLPKSWESSFTLDTIVPLFVDPKSPKSPKSSLSEICCAEGFGAAGV